LPIAKDDDVLNEISTPITTKNNGTANTPSVSGGEVDTIAPSSSEEEVSGVEEDASSVLGSFSAINPSKIWNGEFFDLNSLV